MTVGFRFWRVTTVALLALAACLASSARLTAAPAAGKADLFSQKIWPILSQHCVRCHGAKEQQSGLRVDSLARLLKGGTSGPAIVPGKPDESLLIEAVSQTGDLKMPLKGKLTAEQVSALRNWVSQGAPWSTSVANGARQVRDKTIRVDCCSPARSTSP